MRAVCSCESSVDSGSLASFSWLKELGETWFLATSSAAALSFEAIWSRSS